MKVIITDSNFESDVPEREVLSDTGAVIERHQCRTEAEVIAVARDATAILVQFAPITRDVIEQLEQCTIIVRYGIGFDNVDVEAATVRGIKVCNVPNYCLEEVADHTAAFILALSRRLLPLHVSVLNGQWNVEQHAKPLRKPEHTLVGLVGMGRIGERVVSRLKPFHYQIGVYDPYLSEEKALHMNVRTFARLEDLLEQADMITLHVPLTAGTKSLINEATLRLMKKTAYLINTSRGPLVDNKALARALSDGSLAGAAMDVFEQEPLPLTHPLKACPNVIMTPHAAYYSDSSIIELQRQAAEEIRRELVGETLISRINP